MEMNYIQLEVLLMTGTTFTSGSLCKLNDSGKDDQLTEKEHLEEACWNGLLQGMLPEICWQPADGSTLYLWQVKQGASFLELELGEVPCDLDSHLSITPHLFFSTQPYN